MKGDYLKGTPDRLGVGWGGVGGRGSAFKWQVTFKLSQNYVLKCRKCALRGLSISTFSSGSMRRTLLYREGEHRRCSQMCVPFPKFLHAPLSHVICQADLRKRTDSGWETRLASRCPVPKFLFVHERGADDFQSAWMTSYRSHCTLIGSSHGIPQAAKFLFVHERGARGLSVSTSISTTACWLAGNRLRYFLAAILSLRKY